MSTDGLFSLVKPHHPGVVALRRMMSESALPGFSELGMVLNDFRASNDGPYQLEDVLAARHGNCLGLSAVAVSVLIGHPSLTSGQAFVVILDRGTTTFHAVAAYRARQDQRWSVVDPTRTLRDGFCADIFAADPPPWPDLGEPIRDPATRTMVGFNDREVVTPSWAFERAS